MDSISNSEIHLNADPTTEYPGTETLESFETHKSSQEAIFELSSKIVLLKEIIFKQAVVLNQATETIVLLRSISKWKDETFEESFQKLHQWQLDIREALEEQEIIQQRHLQAISSELEEIASQADLSEVSAFKVSGSTKSNSTTDDLTLLEPEPEMSDTTESVVDKREFNAAVTYADPQKVHNDATLIDLCFNGEPNVQTDSEVSEGTMAELAELMI